MIPVLTHGKVLLIYEFIAVVFAQLLTTVKFMRLEEMTVSSQR